MRRYQNLIASAFPSELGGLFKNLAKNSNPWGLAPRMRMDSAKGLPFEVPVLGADVRLHHSGWGLQWPLQLPGVGGVGVGVCYARLWAVLPPGANPETQFKWFRDRSMELHEYSLIER